MISLPRFNPFAEVPIPGPPAKLTMTDFPSIRITRTIEYTPEAYLEYCKEHELEPNKDDFYWFIENYIDEDFRQGYVDQFEEFIYD